MPFWPFKKRRRNAPKDEPTRHSTAPLTEKAQPEPPPARAATDPPPHQTPTTSTTATQPIAIPARRGSKRRASQQAKSADARWVEGGKHGARSEKENVPEPRRRSSIEDITALPMNRRLENSPHLRPVETDRPHIPYNFSRPYSASQTSLHQQQQRHENPRSRPQTLRSKPSAYESSTPQRIKSNKRRKDDQLREEEIRAMSAQTPIPKRPGDGPLRRDSKKRRSLGAKGSNVSLPAQESIHSSMSGIAEQRGWEIGSFDVFNPRPAVRLSGTPQHIPPGSLPGTSYATPPASRRAKEKMPASDTKSKRRTIGNEADDLGASDLRMLLERDAKRRERRQLAEHEKLDRKLRARSGRNRGDSDRNRRDAEEARKAEEAKRKAEQERRERELMTPPTEIHPALRETTNTREAEMSGLVIEDEQAQARAIDPEKREEPVPPTQNPFDDPTGERVGTPRSENYPVPGAFSPAETPMEDPVVETAREVRLSQTATPPLSPDQTGRAGSSVSQMTESQRSDLSPPPAIGDPRRSSDPKADRRPGAWASFFRRGGTNLRKPDDGPASPFESSFSNTSRESMRNQPLPAHLVGTQSERPGTQRRSGAPTRTQSKFREDLPEMPISPPDSRLPSPDVTTTATAAAAARRAHRADLDAPAVPANRHDTPISPTRSHVPGHGLMSSSLASVDSEASWLASGSMQRHSAHSNLSRSLGSLRARRPDFAASYEELGPGDRDAEYLRRSGATPSPDSKRPLAQARSGSALAGAAAPEEGESEDEDAPRPGSDDPLTVHAGVRRHPTLVHRDSRVKSREGLLTEFDGDEGRSSAGGAQAAAIETADDEDEEEPQMERAQSVSYGKGKGGSRGHARQMSAGSAKLLDVPSPRRPSADVRREASFD